MSPVPDFGGLPPYANFDDVTIKVNDLVQRLRQLLLNLDTLNIRSLNAKVIEAGTITADKMNVNELSAISANLGHITAGLIESVEIYGSYIATRYNSYPRAELDSTENLFGAYASENNFIQIFTPSESLSPVIRFSLTSEDSYIFHDSDGGYVTMTSNDVGINLSSQEYIQLFAPEVFVNNWSFFKNYSTGVSLQNELNNKANSGTSTDPSGSANGGIPIGTQLRTADGGVVTWMGVPAHSHTQN